MQPITKTIIYPAQFITWQLIVVMLCIAACNNTENNKVTDTVIAETPQQADVKQAELIEKLVSYAAAHEGKVNDSIRLKQLVLLQKLYSQNNYQPIWNKEENWEAIADSLYNIVRLSRLYGLFPADYHSHSLLRIRNTVITDSLQRKNAALWARADVLFTDALFGIAHDLKLGRLAKDSVTLRSDSLLNDDYFFTICREAITNKNIRPVLEALEPQHEGYHRLKSAIPAFLDSATFKKFTYVFYPNKDSLALLKQVEKRLSEAGFNIISNDTTSLKEAISKYQKQKGIKVTGKVGEQTTRSLNNTDWEKFKRIALTLDRYKQLPDSMPGQYIWVNIPSYYMQLRQADTVVFESRVVVGKPNTRTPLLTGSITNMVTYPQWTIPTSIITKEILPGVKRNPNYLAKKGYMLLTNEGELVDPATVNWLKYTKGIPYRVVQGSGDDNALGILKFNFNNKYSVYLHDTNQRYLFKNASRALSHGCVRVQEWSKLAQFIIATDSMKALLTDSTRYTKTDSLQAWLTRKEKHIIPVRNRLPVYIRYYSCEGKDGKVKFYEDIYGEDRILTERYFANKQIN
ncbi:MAG: hypothetical protein EAZ16_10570 [Sphingobacteriales bacterium]|nr:MAG: hypothetical protein EAZ16_10570 [Sphingobacteriales bacterium]